MVWLDRSMFCSDTACVVDWVAPVAAAAPKTPFFYYHTPGWNGKSLNDVKMYDNFNCFWPICRVFFVPSTAAVLFLLLFLFSLYLSLSLSLSLSLFPPLFPPLYGCVRISYVFVSLQCNAGLPPRLRLKV